MNLKSAFPLIDYGIFDFLTDMPYATIVDNVTLNNTIYFSFGERLASPALSHFMFNTQPDIDGLHTVVDADAAKLAAMISARYRDKWERYGALMDLEYNPIENYNMSERGADSASGIERGQNSRERGAIRNLSETNEMARNAIANSLNVGETSNSNNLESSKTSNKAVTEETAGQDNIYGFNSVTHVPKSDSTENAKTAESQSDTEKNANSGTATSKDSASTSSAESNNSKTLSSNAEKENENVNNELSKSNNSLHTLTRAGNIGVTTTQQMMKQEREFWNWSFIKVVVEDVAEFLTLATY